MSNFFLVEFENECEYVEATTQEFVEWKDGAMKTNSPFAKYDINENWAYADYKYMIELVDENLLDSWVRILKRRYVSSSSIYLTFFSV